MFDAIRKESLKKLIGYFIKGSDRRAIFLTSIIIFEAVVSASTIAEAAGPFEFSGSLEPVVGRLKFELTPGSGSTCKLISTSETGETNKKVTITQNLQILIKQVGAQKAVEMTVTQSGTRPAIVTSFINADGTVAKIDVKDSSGAALSDSDQRLKDELERTFQSLGPVDQQLYGAGDGITPYQRGKLETAFDEQVEEYIITPLVSEQRKKDPTAEIKYVKAPLSGDFPLIGTTMIDGHRHLVFQGSLSVTYYLNGKPLKIYTEGYQVVDQGSGLAHLSAQKVSMTLLTTSVGTSDFPLVIFEQRGSCEITRSLTPIAPQAAPATTPGVTQRLEAVNDLLRRGLITEQEAAEKRKEILRAL
ncbi:MAG: hypothetical protein AB7M05_09855 [Alphaproteobacteria bacterium]